MHGYTHVVPSCCYSKDVNVWQLFLAQITPHSSKLAHQTSVLEGGFLWALIRKEINGLDDSRGGWTQSCDIPAYAILYGDFCIKSAIMFSR